MSGAPGDASRGRPGLTAGSLLLLLVLATPVLLGALAGPARAEDRPFQMAIRVEADNGYDLALRALHSRRGEKLRIRLRRGSGTAEYLKAHGFRLTRDHLAADLGELGSIDLDFEVRNERTPVICRRGEIRSGSFSGSLDFQGERGYTSVHRRKAKGRVLIGPSICRFGRPGPSSLRADAERRRRRELFLVSCGPDPRVGFLALRYPFAGPQTLFGASRIERDDDLLITRTAIASTDDKTGFHASRDLHSATVRPPGTRFAGTGTYASGALSGNLRAALPGAGIVPLVPAEAQLTRRYREIGDPPCFEAPAGAGASLDPETLRAAG